VDLICLRSLSPVDNTLTRWVSSNLILLSAPTNTLPSARSPMSFLYWGDRSIGLANDCLPHMSPSCLRRHVHEWRWANCPVTGAHTAAHRIRRDVGGIEHLFQPPMAKATSRRYRGSRAKKRRAAGAVYGAPACVARHRPPANLNGSQHRTSAWEAAARCIGWQYVFESCSETPKCIEPIGQNEVLVGLLAFGYPC
jgi:hypothetical protein